MRLAYLLLFGFFSSGLCQQTCFGSNDIPSIAGRYLDNYGGKQTVTQWSWVSTYQTSALVFHNCLVQNAQKDLIAQNDGAHPTDPWKYSRFEWTTYQNSLWYCQQVYDADTIAEAESRPRANPSNPDTGGCGIPTNNFPWTRLTKLTPKPHGSYHLSLGAQTCSGASELPSIAGRYLSDDSHGYQDIDQYIWNSTGLIFHLCTVNNKDHNLYAQNDEHNSWNPNLFSRFEWTTDSQHQLWYCQQVYNAASIEAAEQVPKADPSNPSQSGCGIPNPTTGKTFPWSLMIKMQPKPAHIEKTSLHGCHGGKEKPEIIGAYRDNYGGYQTITHSFWNSSGSIFSICSVDNSQNDLIAQNDGQNPIKFSRFEWTRVEKQHTLWYCQQVYDANTKQEAESRPRADPKDPAKGGCGIPNNNFPWSQMIKISKHKKNGHHTCPYKNREKESKQKEATPSFKLDL